MTKSLHQQRVVFSEIGREQIEAAARHEEEKSQHDKNHCTSRSGLLHRILCNLFNVNHRRVFHFLDFRELRLLGKLQIDCVQDIDVALQP